MSYAELLDAVLTDGAMEWGPVIVLTAAEREACTKLNALREDTTNKSDSARRVPARGAL